MTCRMSPKGAHTHTHTDITYDKAFPNMSKSHVDWDSLHKSFQGN